MVRSRDKGKRGERAARDEVRRWWHAPRCIRSAQAGGAFTADLLHALDGAHVEVKSHKRIAAFRFIDQAQRDKYESDEFPIVLMKEDGGAWAVLFQIEDTEAFVQAYLKNLDDN